MHKPSSLARLATDMPACPAPSLAVVGWHCSQTYLHLALHPHRTPAELPPEAAAGAHPAAHSPPPTPHRPFPTARALQPSTNSCCSPLLHLSALLCCRQRGHLRGSGERGTCGPPLCAGVGDRRHRGRGAAAGQALPPRVSEGPAGVCSAMAYCCGPRLCGMGTAGQMQALPLLVPAESAGVGSSGHTQEWGSCPSVATWQSRPWVLQNASCSCPPLPTTAGSCWRAASRAAGHRASWHAAAAAAGSAPLLQLAALCFGGRRGSLPSGAHFTSALRVEEHLL